MTAADDEVRLARAYLMRVAEPPARALQELIAMRGVVRTAELVRADRVSAQVAAETSARRHVELAVADLEAAEAVGARLLVPEDDDWPAWQLLCLTAEGLRRERFAVGPLGLWVRGASAAVKETFNRAVSVVGARSATGYGEFVAAETGYHLARADTTVVSGAAYGIDGAAHRGALAAEGVTVAVLACGVDLPYPLGHATLIDQIVASGLVISEYPPGTPPAKHRFLVRNRLIAALSSATVVVEAGRRSGARNTATMAKSLGKPVLAVPGPVTSAASAGCHELIHDGAATIVGSVAQIVEETTPLGENPADRTPGPARRTDGLGDQALRVHEALRRREGRSYEQVAVDSGIPLDRVRALLPELELTGLAERCDGGWRQAVAP